MNELVGNETIDKVLLAISQQTNNINSVLSAIGAMGKRIGDIELSVTGLKGDVETLKNEEEIKTKDAKTIKKLVNKIISRRLGINENPSKRSLEEKVTDQKYRSMFSSTLYTEVSEQGHLASPYSETAKKDFVAACEDIEKWYPREGIDGLKKRADENAIARKIAKEQGY